MSRRHYFAIGTIAATTLFCEIALTRLFSVVQYYHGAFLAISLALFGFAVSGVFVFLRSDSLTRERLDAALARYGLLFALSIPLSFYAYLYAGVQPALSALRLPPVSTAAIEYALLAVPFFASGVCISLLLSHGARQANRLYAVDLASSAAGAVLVVPALSLFGGPRSMLLASAAAAVATFPFLRAVGRERVMAPLLGVCAVTAALFVPASEFNKLHIRKEAFLIASEPIRWNSFSMVGVARDEREREGSLEGNRVRTIVIDNSVGTEMIAFDGDLAKVSFLKQDFAAPAHRLRRDAKVLVIGAGGGRDILIALVHGQRHVRAVEVNPLVVQMADELFGDFTGRVYSVPHVKSVLGDARSYIANSEERFDIILASLIDTWAASAAGAFALTENLLYTTDAFRDYYEHLTDDGILSISRWHPAETPRLLSTGLTAWREAGVSEPRRHAMMILTPVVPVLRGRISTLLMKKTPFSEDEIRTIEEFCSEAGLSLAFTPDRIEDPVVKEYFEAYAVGSRTEPWPGIDVSPASDERPFFFNMIRPSTQAKRMLGLTRDSDRAGGAFQANLSATRMLIQLFFAVVLLLIFAVLTPLALRGGRVRGRHWISILGYFACLGLGFILIEIGLLQRLILLLGKPVYALALILSTMLLASGLGSFVSGRFALGQLAGRLTVVLLAAAALLGSYGLLLPPLIRGLLGSPFLVRAAAAVLMVGVAGFLLGMPFPSGIRALESQGGAALIPWVWGVNGAMSVLASVGGIIAAIEFGYTVVFLLGAACYALAAWLLQRWATLEGPGLGAPAPSRP